MKKVSIVIPTYNGYDLVSECLDSILTMTPPHEYKDIEYEIIIADDGSTDRTSHIVSIRYRNSPVKIVRSEENRGFAKTVNMGIQKAKYDLILLLNNDVKIEKTDWLRIMVEAMDEYDLTAPAAGRMDKKWNYIPGEATSNKALNKNEFNYPVGWCLMLKRKVFDTIGLIPENFGKGFFEDVLFGWRAINAGFKWGIADALEYNMKVKGDRRVFHQYHTTFKREGYAIGLEYTKKREIFLKIINSERKKV